MCEARYRSHSELARAKRSHTLSLSPSPRREVAAVAVPCVQHPCERAASPGGTLGQREWKYSPQQSEDGAAQRSLSCRALAHAKRTHSASLLPTPPSPPSPHDPCAPRFTSLIDLQLQKQYHATPLYPTQVKVPVGHDVLAAHTPCPGGKGVPPGSMLQEPPTKEWRSWQCNGPRHDSHRQLETEKRRHMRGREENKGGVAGCLRGGTRTTRTEGVLYRSHRQLTYDKRLPGGTGVHNNSPTASCRRSQSTTSHRDLERRKATCSAPIQPRRAVTPPPPPVQAAGCAVQRTPAVIFAADGAAYPPADCPETPGEPRTSHVALQEAKRRGATQLYHVGRPEAALRSREAHEAQVSQRVLSSDRKRHARGSTPQRAVSPVPDPHTPPFTPPARTPLPVPSSVRRSLHPQVVSSPSPPFHTPPQYVGIRNPWK